MTHEYTGNLHLHSIYSDGHGDYERISRAAIRAGLDFVVVTDHNVWVDGVDGYRYLDRERVLLLTGEEVHDQARQPQKNHLLVYEARAELASHAAHPQELINRANGEGGLAFIAHPIDPAAPRFDEEDLSWVDWEVHGYTGLEIWNYMSEFKSHLHSIPEALYSVYFADNMARGPFPGVLERWDQLLREGKRIVAIGGSDAHATPASMGPLRRIVFPYSYLFRTVNTHVLTDAPLTGDAEIDRRRIFHAIRLGRCFVGYDLPASTRGFRFVAQGENETADMGSSLRIRYGVTLQVHTPQKAILHLIRDGERLEQWHNTDTAVITVDTPGAYRVEAYIPYRGRMRAWIFSNPIYLT